MPLKITTFVGPYHPNFTDGTLEVSKITIHRYYLWDSISINWEDFKYHKNNLVIIPLPTSVTLPLIHKYKFRQFFDDVPNRDVHIMLRKDDSWFAVPHKLNTLALFGESTLTLNSHPPSN